MTAPGGIIRWAGSKSSLLRSYPSDTHDLCIPSSPYLTLFQAVRNLALNLSTSSGSAGSVPDELRAATPDPEGARLLESGIRVCPLGRRQSGRRASSGLPLRYCAAAGDTEFMDAPGRKTQVSRRSGELRTLERSPATKTALLCTRSRDSGFGRSGYPGFHSQRHLGGPEHPDTSGRGHTPSHAPGVSIPHPSPVSPHPPYLTAQARTSP